MKIIRPVEITAERLTSAEVAADAAPAWSNATSYAKGDVVTKNRRRWSSLQAPNQGHDPEDAASTWWVDAGPTNPWAMFDRSTGTLSVDQGEMKVTLAPGAIDALALVDLDAASVRVIMKVNAAAVYDSQGVSTNAGGVAIDNWFAYFFEPIGRTRVMTFLDLPVYEAGVVEVTITGDSPQARVAAGTLIVGRQLDLGLTEAKPKVGIVDYSRKVTDQFGVTDVVERGFAKKMSVRTLLPTSSVEAVQDALAAIRATPVLWLGAQGFASLAVYGFYQDFDIDLETDELSYCTLNVLGLA